MPQRTRNTSSSSSAAAATNDVVVPLTALYLTLASDKRGRAGEHGTDGTAAHLFVDELMLLRHGERQDHAERAWRGSAHLPATDAPLSHTGRVQVLETALQLRAARLARRLCERVHGTYSYMLVSPFHRCVETAVLLSVVAFDGTLAMYVDPQLAEWQHVRLYRSGAPALAGCFVLHPPPPSSPPSSSSSPQQQQQQQQQSATSARTRRRTQLRFRPHLAALRATLLPFLQAQAAAPLPAGDDAGHRHQHGNNKDDTSRADDDTSDASAAVRHAAAQGWVRCLERWLHAHHTLPVWTCAPVTAALHASLCASKADDEDDGNVDDRNASTTRSSSSSSSCGVPYPESRHALQQRCEAFVRTHFVRDTHTGACDAVPRAILAAVAHERAHALPKYLQAPSATTTTTAVAKVAATAMSSRAHASAVALLPPMRVIAVTHADVVQGVLRACCPRHHSVSSNSNGFAVPCCSVTTLRRCNNYYTLPHDDTTTTMTAATAAAATARGNTSSGSRQHRNNNSNAATTTTTRRPAGTATLSADDWWVVCAASTELLTTRVHVHFDR